MGMTNEEAIAAWNAGKEVKVVEMGGLSLGYEITIWNMAFAMLSEMLKTEWDWDKFWAQPEVDQKKDWADFKEELEDRPAVRQAIKDNDPTGAQFSAALGAATIFWQFGYEGALAKAPADRIIPLQTIFNLGDPQ